LFIIIFLIKIVIFILFFFLTHYCKIGSTPGERMKINGVLLFESSNELARSNGGGSTNLCPNFDLTNS